MPLDVRLVLAHLASAARTPHPSGRPCAVARRARLRRGLLAMLGAGALAGVLTIARIRRNSIVTGGA